MRDEGNRLRFGCNSKLLVCRWRVGSYAIMSADSDINIFLMIHVVK
jgi:hypothetical protein